MSEGRALIPGECSTAYYVLEIKEGYAAIRVHGRGLLREAKRIGDALLAVKQQLPHGSFKPWVERYCPFPYRTAARYMQVAKCVVHDTFDDAAAIDSILDTNGRANRSQPTTTSTSPTFDRGDAEHALKLHALAERGVGGEAENAKAKLDAYAESFGMTAEEIVEKAEELCPDFAVTAEQARVSKLEEALAFVQEKYGQKSRDQLLKVIAILTLELSEKK